jgi:hypothetical protein
MEKDGRWLGGSGYGYGYPMAGYGYPMERNPAETTTAYLDARPGYDVRMLVAAANILARHGEQQSCERVLATTRKIYKNWWPGKKVLISPRSAREIDWNDKLVHLNVNRQKVKDSPAYDASTTVDRTYEKHFHGYYGEVEPSDRR